MRKRRRLARFGLAAGIVTDDPDPGHEPRCEAELTEIRTRDQDWWSLGLEATGPADLLRRALEATAGLVLPGPAGRDGARPP